MEVRKMRRIAIPVRALIPFFIFALSSSPAIGAAAKDLKKQSIEASEPAESQEYQTAVPGPYLQNAEIVRQGAKADLHVEEFVLDPSTPSTSETVEVRVHVYNSGTAPADAFTVEWWPGERYPVPGCTWRVEGLAANGGRVLTCSGYVYPSWYGSLPTVVKVDSGGEISELNETDNTMTQVIQVTR
jgi:hypothetical protein